jgi:pilus assembly protein Flp/PilA
MLEQIRQFLRFNRNEEGATAVEYGIMVAAIAAVIIAVVFTIGERVNEAFEDVDTELQDAGYGS